MRAAALVLAASAAVAAPALAQADGRMYICEGAAIGADGEEVDVFLVRSGPGGYSSSNALWFPPLASPDTETDNTLPDVVLSINYERSAPGRIGEVRSVMAVAAITTSPRANEQHGTLQRRLAAYKIDYAFDGAAPKVLTVEQMGEDKSPPGSAAAQADLGQVIPLPGTVDMRMMQGKKNPQIVRRFVLTRTSTRDTLYAKAWAEADAKFASPAGKCDPIN
jgi:hypothetical protein